MLQFTTQKIISKYGLNTIKITIHEVPFRLFARRALAGGRRDGSCACAGCAIPAWHSKYKSEHTWSWTGHYYNSILFTPLLLYTFWRVCWSCPLKPYNSQLLFKQHHLSVFNSDFHVFIIFLVDDKQISQFCKTLLASRIRFFLSPEFSVVIGYKRDDWQPVRQINRGYRGSQTICNCWGGKPSQLFQLFLTYYHHGFSSHSNR